MGKMDNAQLSTDGAVSTRSTYGSQGEFWPVWRGDAATRPGETTLSPRGLGLMRCEAISMVNPSIELVNIWNTRDTNGVSTASGLR